MATTSALMPSPTFPSAYSSYSGSSSSSRHYTNIYQAMQRHSGTSDSLAPPSPYSPMVDPSPVESTKSASTDATDIEIDGGRDIDELKSPDIEVISPASHDAHSATHNHVARLATDAATIAHGGGDEGPISVIHIPSTFKQFTNPLPTTHEEQQSNAQHVVTSSNRSEGKKSPPSAGKERVSPTSLSGFASPGSIQGNSMSMHSINTQVPPVRSGAGSTPRASTQEEAEAELKKARSHVVNSSIDSLTDQDEKTETGDSKPPSQTSSYPPLPDVQIVAPSSPPPTPNIPSNEAEIYALKEALTECWTLCKTLAKMSSGHRQRMFSFSNTGEVQDKAWKSCWTLCQTLYEGRDAEPSSQATEILDLCREFCQALFEARDVTNAVQDSILRVSFELNNHLFNTRNLQLPDAFTERTLQFYVTLCHRLIKDHTSLPEDTDLLLRACWNLAECFFTFRERGLEKRFIDEETLSSTVQACWDLCDIFRERWSLSRPERNTPRPQTHRNQPTTTYTSAAYSNQYSNSSTPAYTQPAATSRPPSALSTDRASRLLGPNGVYGRGLPPETPTTIMDERDDDEEGGPKDLPPPNLLVYGGETASRRSVSRWPSSASNTSGYSDASGSQHTTNSSMTTTKVAAISNNRNSGPGTSQTSPKSVTSATARGSSGTVIDQSQAYLTAVKALVVRAALNKGFSRTNLSPVALQSFVREQTAITMFGGEPWQRQLFDQYKRCVLMDPFILDNNLPANRRFSSLEVAYAVNWISKNDHYAWIPSLYETVFGFAIDATDHQNRGSGLQV